jgi:hypothetical protein
MNGKRTPALTRGRGDSLTFQPPVRIYGAIRTPRGTARPIGYGEPSIETPGTLCERPRIHLWRRAGATLGKA